jgi:hypothetical protein
MVSLVSILKMNTIDTAKNILNFYVALLTSLLINQLYLIDIFIWL